LPPPVFRKAIMKIMKIDEVIVFWLCMLFATPESYKGIVEVQVK